MIRIGQTLGGFAAITPIWRSRDKKSWLVSVGFGASRSTGFGTLVSAAPLHFRPPPDHQGQHAKEQATV